MSNIESAIQGEILTEIIEDGVEEGDNPQGVVYEWKWSQLLEELLKSVPQVSNQVLHKKVITPEGIQFVFLKGEE